MNTKVNAVKADFAKTTTENYLNRIDYDEEVLNKFVDYINREIMSQANRGQRRLGIDLYAMQFRLLQINIKPDFNEKETNLYYNKLKELMTEAGYKLYNSYGDARTNGGRFTISWE